MFICLSSVSWYALYFFLILSCVCLIQFLTFFLPSFRFCFHRYLIFAVNIFIYFVYSASFFLFVFRILFFLLPSFFLYMFSKNKQHSLTRRHYKHTKHHYQNNLLFLFSMLPFFLLYPNFLVLRTLPFPNPFLITPAPGTCSDGECRVWQDPL